MKKQTTIKKEEKEKEKEYETNEEKKGIKKKEKEYLKRNENCKDKVSPMAALGHHNGDNSET
jgi:hypothetical protein